MREVDKVGFIMSDRVYKCIEEENNDILWMLHNDEAIYVHAYYSEEDDGKRIYDWDMMREEFEQNMENLIQLNKQKGLVSE